MTRIFSVLVAAAAAAILASGVGVAQTQTRVGSQKDWAIFQAGDGTQKICWIATSPTESSALRGGQQVDVNRGDIFLMVAFRPSDGANNEVSFLAGYPFKPNSKVEATVGSSNFELFTKGENAWLNSSDRDAEIIEAFKKGANVKVTGVSSRGTTTVDTFSLLGFTAARDEAQKLCS